MDVESSKGVGVTRQNEPDQRVFFFGNSGAEGNADMKEVLGGKGANLAEMAGLGIPVPPGFTVSTAVCREFYENNRNLPEDVKSSVLENLAKVEKDLGKKFGDVSNPLLVSVRSAQGLVCLG